MTNEEGLNKLKKDTFKNKKWKDVRKMGHSEGFDALEGGVEQFLQRITEIWPKERAKERGKTKDRMELTIGIRNRTAGFEPTVTTDRGVKNLYIWNLLTEDITTIKRKANDIELLVSEVPYFWPRDLPAIFPGQLSPESLPTKREK